MFSKIITVLFAANVISAANGFIDSKLRVLEPILKCYEGNAPEFPARRQWQHASISIQTPTTLNCRAE